MRPGSSFFSAAQLPWQFLCACSIWLGFPSDFFSWPPLVLLWPVCLAIIGAKAATGVNSFLAGWLATWPGMLLALYWLALPLAQVGGLPWPLAFLCAALIAALLASQGAFFCALAHAFRHLPALRKLLALSLAWYLLEYAYAVCVGFPWLPLAGGLAQWPLLIQTADIFGAYFMGAVWLFCILLSCEAFKDGQPILRRLLWLLSGITAASCLLWYGVFELAAALGASESETAIDCVMVQGNVDQNQKWTPPFQRESLARYLRLTSAGLDRAHAIGMESPLIIWPETAMPFFYELSPDLGGRIRNAVSVWGCPLLFGAPGQENGGELIFNRAFLLAPSGQTLGTYDKMHLVPFGEYLPRWLRLDFLEKLLQGIGVYEEGASMASLDYGALALGLLICYEGIFPWLARDRVSHGANILVDISNDGWFGRTPAARQHLYLTLLRCVEQERWLLRATNTGISAVADNCGRITQEGQTFREEYLLCRALCKTAKSIFYHLEPLLPWLALAFFCGLAKLGRQAED
ncbi:MAG: apolipoprotein N-acyltransferase [Desulfovibrio sp.]|nr:apolipoprotein N-acyltransferase [Desulfovibrio sp.]